MLSQNSQSYTIVNGGNVCTNENVAAGKLFLAERNQFTNIQVG